MIQHFNTTMLQQQQQQHQYMLPRLLAIFILATTTTAWVPTTRLQQRSLSGISSSSSSSSSNSKTRLFENGSVLLTSENATVASWIQSDFDTSTTAFTDSRSILTSQAVVIGPQHVLVYDTTLRDGTQGESVSASVDDKLKIFQRMAAFDMDYIEAGWPGSNPKDVEFFQRAQTLFNDREKSKLVAFGSTRRKRISVSDDAQVQALLDSQAPTVCIVAKAHLWQVTDILQATPQENLQMIIDTVQYLNSRGRQVMVDLEHFFDGYAHDADYALQCAHAAARAGAICLVLCETNGGTMPWRVAETVDAVRNYFAEHSSSSTGNNSPTIGIHCHNDCGMAVANSLIAAQHGVGLIQGTLNGLGERTGNADLCSIVPTLGLHMQSKMTCRTHLSELTSLSRFVDEILNRTPNHAAPFVGASAFAHKGGLHVAAMERSPLSYQHVHPEAVGNEKRVLISELSGRQNILDLMQQQQQRIGVDSSVQVNNERALAILERVKQLESQGYTFEGAEASVQLMILHSQRGYCPPFNVLDYSAHVYDSNLDSASRVLQASGSSSKVSPATSRATVRVRTQSTNLTDEDLYQDNLEVGDGNGPVDALANALLRALVPVHPSLQNVELVDYKVRILDPTSATRAATRVMIEFRDTTKDTTWTTVSVETNVISASLNALIDGLEYALIEHAESCLLCDDDFE